MTTYDPADGVPGIDDNAPGSPPDPDPSPGRRLAFAYAAIRCLGCGKVVLREKSQYCLDCDAERRRMVSEWAVSLRAQYMADPITA